MVIRDFRKIYGFFHLTNVFKGTKLLDFGGCLARNTMFSRRYWTNSDEYIDIPREARLDSFDLFGVCHFPVYKKVYDHIYSDLEELKDNHYDITALVDVAPYLEWDVLWDIVCFLADHSSALLLQFPLNEEVPIDQLRTLGDCKRIYIVGYDYYLIRTFQKIK